MSRFHSYLTSINEVIIHTTFNVVNEFSALEFFFNFYVIGIFNLFFERDFHINGYVNAKSD